MADEVKDLRKLVIKAFHMSEIEWGEHNDIKVDGHMTVSKEMVDELVAGEEHIEKIDIQLIKPGDHDRWISCLYLQRFSGKSGMGLPIQLQVCMSSLQG